MLFAIDCGNTHLVLGLFDGETLLRSWRLSTDVKKTEDEYMALFNELLAGDGYRLADVDGVVIASVVPTINFLLYKLADKYLRCPCLFITATTPTFLKVCLDNPAELGADRLVNAVSARDKFPQGPLIVVDLGTATTFDVVTSDDCYLGGVICPGIEISQQALFSHAAKLASVDLRRPPAVIGRNTADSLRSGVLWGYGGQIDTLVRRIEEELGEKATVVATGGLASFIRGFTETIQHVAPQLTLDGLRLIWDMEQKVET